MNTNRYVYALEGLERRQLFSTAVLLADANTSATAATFVPGIAVGNIMYGGGESADSLAQLWRSDGTAAGTSVIQVGSSEDDSLSDLTVFGNKIAYKFGDALYISDGVAGHAVELNSDVYEVSAVGGKLWYSTPNGLFASDGTVAGATQVSTITSEVPTFAGPDGAAYFIKPTDYDYPTIGSLWRTDGTAAGTSEINSGRVVMAGAAGSSAVYIVQPTADGPASLYLVAGSSSTLLHSFSVQYLSTYETANLGNNLIFTAFNSATNSNTFWKTDGTSAGTVPLDPTGSTFDAADHLTAVGNHLIFNTVANGNIVLETSDGTAGGTSVLETLNGLSTDPIAVGVDGDAYVSTLNFSEIPEIYRTDGSSAGTSRVGVGTSDNFNQYFKNIVATSTGEVWANTLATYTTTTYLNPTGGVDALAPFAPVGTELSSGFPKSILVGSPYSYFLGVEPGTINHPTLYRTDGTTAGTTALTATPFDSYIGPAVLSGDDLLFVADADSGYGIYRSDGTTAGTTSVFIGSSSLHLYSDGAGGAYFLANATATSSGTYSLYHTDGTSAGTTVLTANVASMSAVLPVGGTSYLQLVLPSTGQGSTNTILASNGTAAGTSTLYSSTSYFNGSAPLLVAGNHLLFVYNQLQSLDLTTRQVTQLPPTSVTSFAGTTVGSDAYFVTGDDTLWKTDGTAAGTVQLYAAPTVDATSGYVGSLAAFGGKVFFSASDSSNDTELWTTDGTAAGTGVFDNISASTSSFPRDLTVSGSTLYFIADDGTHGQEMWSTDGTVAGTALVADINPGGTSSPDNVVAAPNGQVWFSADDGVHGDELWTTAAGSSTGGGGGTTGGGGGTTTTLNNLAVTTTLTGKSNIVGGQKGLAHVIVQNNSGAALNAPATVQLVLSSTATGSGTSTAISGVPFVLKLKSNQKKSIAVHFVYPASAVDGLQYVLAVVVSNDTTTAGGTGVSDGVNYVHAFADVSAASATAAAKYTAGKNGIVTLLLNNEGSVLAAGPTTFAFTLTGGSLGSAVTLPSATKSVKVVPGKSRPMKLRITVPTGLAAGTYTLTISVTPGAGIPDTDTADKSATVNINVV